jgi:hypothetical protein
MKLAILSFCLIATSANAVTLPDDFKPCTYDLSLPPQWVMATPPLIKGELGPPAIDDPIWRHASCDAKHHLVKWRFP